MSELKIVIGIPTFKRPVGLERLLVSLNNQVSEFRFEIIVADNEGVNGAGSRVVDKLLVDGYKVPIKVIPVIERGISQVRNSLMHEAFMLSNADMLAMIDDDEWAEDQWIDSLVKVQQKTGADIVGGSVAPEFEVSPPPWVKGLSIYYQSEQSESGPVEMVAGTTNVLLNRSLVDKYPEENFDPFYSLVGGGDKEYFTRLKRRGAIFAFSHKAKSHEVFGQSRLTKSWAIERSYRIGAGDLRIIMISRPSLIAWFNEISKIAGGIVIAPIKMLFFCSSPHNKMNARLMFSRQLGKLSAFWGVHKKVYKDTHGN